MNCSNCIYSENIIIDNKQYLREILSFTILDRFQESSLLCKKDNVIIDKFRETCSEFKEKESDKNLFDFIE